MGYRGRLAIVKPPDESPPREPRPRSLAGRPPLPEQIAEASRPPWLAPARAVASSVIVLSLAGAMLAIKIGLAVIDGIDGVARWVQS